MNARPSWVDFCRNFKEKCFSGPQTWVTQGIVVFEKALKMIYKSKLLHNVWINWEIPAIVWPAVKAHWAQCASILFFFFFCALHESLFSLLLSSQVSIGFGDAKGNFDFYLLGWPWMIDFDQKPYFVQSNVIPVLICLFVCLIWALSFRSIRFSDAKGNFDFYLQGWPWMINLILVLVCLFVWSGL